ncbi:hypothetical protein ACSBR2_008908 [Camellia fascicularis]
MDSTPNPTFISQTNHNHHHHHLSIKASASKLPIKRKTPETSSSSSNPNPNPNRNLSPILPPKLEHATTDDGGSGGDDDNDVGGADRNPPPFKFHRIWTEPDEIRFLQGLLDRSSERLSFPRDLNVFFATFSDTMSQPYTKSQLSEKLRRLRKKFRVISSRLARGLDKALLSPHDRALFDLSKQLWHPEFSSTSPFGASNKQKKSNLVRVKVRFSPTLPSALIPASNQPITYELNDHRVLNCIGNDHNDEDGGDDRVFVGGSDVKLSEVNVEFDGGVREQELPMSSGSGEGGGGGRCDSESGLRQVVAKTVINLFDQCLKEVKMALVRQGLLRSDHGSGTQAGSSKDDFEKRWREQRVAELDLLARRLSGRMDSAGKGMLEVKA